MRRDDAIRVTALPRREPSGHINPPAPSTRALHLMVG
jgi:hypothetical protein